MNEIEVKFVKKEFGDHIILLLKKNLIVGLILIRQGRNSQQFFYYIQKPMKVSHSTKQTPYRRNSYRENTKSSYYNQREEQKPTYNFIEQTKIRIVQDNLVSVSGLPSEYDDPNLLGDNQHFGKYGTVDKIIISSQGKHRSALIQVYITYEKSVDAAFAIKALDGIKIKGRQITATFGTTKYCTYFLKQNDCRNEKCFYLHGYDTKNELMDGVKNNMDFLDEKSQNIINNNLKYYLEKQLIEKDHKDLSQFPTIGETIHYLIEQEIIDQKYVTILRKQIEEEKKKNSKTISSKNEAISLSESSELSDAKKTAQQLSNVQKMKKSPQIGNKSDEVRSKGQGQDDQGMALLSQIVTHLQTGKEKKCHSLSTTSSPTKYQKMTELQAQSIDKTIQRRIIKQIMRSNMIFRSKMDFVTKTNTNAKEENNKIKNYVRKYLLNQI